jgi:hypothetical protein
MYIIYPVNNIYITMSQYFDKNDLFLEPKTTQYGSHMVMTNVHKPTKRKFINIDTKFSDDYNYLTVANCNVTLPERINEVKNVSIASIELPMSFYNISSSLGNNSFQVSYNSTHGIIIIPDGEYTSTNLKATINSVISSMFSIDLSFNITASSTGGEITSVSSGYSCLLNFAVNDKGVVDKYNIKSKLGWMLGFHQVEYNILAPIYAEFKIDLNGPRYLYLALEEFHNGNKNSFVSTISSGLVNKNIIARITLDKSNYGFGTILPANKLNGFLLSDTRKYTGKVDLQKINLQLLNEIGNPISLNGFDYSLCLEVEHD